MLSCEAEVERYAAQSASAFPGAVSPATGLVKNANSTWLIGKPLAEDLSARLGRPVRLANDANCFALSEAVDGAGAGAGVVFGVILGTGVGGGIVVGGRPSGRRERDRRGVGTQPAARCAATRPERVARARVLLRPVTAASRPSSPARGWRATITRTPATHLDAAPRSPRARPTATPKPRRACARYEDRLARGLASIINVLDPDVIVLGGGLSNVSRLYDERAAAMAAVTCSRMRSTRGWCRRAHGDSSGVRGAAWLWPA